MNSSNFPMQSATIAAAPPGIGAARPIATPVHHPQGFFRRRLGWIIAAAVILLVIAGLGFRLRGRKKSDVTYVTKPVARGNVDETVDATGAVAAVTSVQVGAQVSGSIAKLYVDFNSRVHGGELLAQIDPRVYEGQLLQAQANLDSSRANLAASKANLANTMAKAAQARADYVRAVSLAKQGIMSPQQFDAAKATAESADAQVTANQSAVAQAVAQVSQQDAALKVAQTNLAYTNIYAPIDGTVINRSVDVGQTVAASFQTPTLFTIARDLTKMQLHVSTDEGDIGAVHSGSPVNFRVDAYPGEIFHGRISQVRMNATTVQNVTTYETIVDFDNPKLELFPGMTAYATIPVKSASDVLNVPSSATRYNPNKSQVEIAALYTKYGIEIPRGHSTDTSFDNSDNGAVNMAVVWKLHPDGAIEPVLIRSGVTDHTSTEVVQVVKGTLSVGDVLVTSEQAKPSGFGG